MVTKKPFEAFLGIVTRGRGEGKGEGIPYSLTKGKKSVERSKGNNCLSRGCRERGCIGGTALSGENSKRLDAALWLGTFLTPLLGVITPMEP